MTVSTSCSPPSRLALETRWWLYRLRHPRRHRILQRRRRQVTPDGYGCKPFDDTRSIFVHVPKCAGVSMSRALYGNLGGGHATLDEYLEIFEPRAICRYFKFAVVRNPWDRLVSSFHFLQAGGFDDQDRRWRDRHRDVLRDFDAFVDWLNPERIWQKEHLKPQCHYLLDSRGRVALDFLALQENLADDFCWIAGRLGARTELIRSNRSPHRPFAHYYGPRTRAKVAHLYREDVDLLGYVFDNAHLPEQLQRRARLGGSLFLS